MGQTEHLLKKIAKMNFYSIFYLLVGTNWFVSRCSAAANTCDFMGCRREGGSGKMRIGHVPIKFLEMPYLGILLGPQGNPFCVGVLVNNEELLTTCSCAYHHVYFQIGFGTFDHDYNIKWLRKREKRAITPHPKCIKGAPFDDGDFATIILDSPIHPFRTFNLKTWFPSQIRDYLSVNAEKLTVCYAVGYGGYDFVGPKASREGKRMGVLQKYDYRLLPDRFCNKYNRGCCGDWLSIGIGKTRIESTGLHCIVRGHQKSKCFGDLGSPVVCQGYLFGFMTGHIRCTVDGKNHAGPDLFLPIANAISFIRHRHRITQMYPWVPKSMPRKEVWVTVGGEEGGVTVPEGSATTSRGASDDDESDGPVPPEGEENDYTDILPPLKPSHGSDEEEDEAMGEFLLRTFFPNETIKQEKKENAKVAEDYYYDYNAAFCLAVSKRSLQATITTFLLTFGHNKLF